MSGTLRVLIYAPTAGDEFCAPTFLGWSGAPPDASADRDFIDTDLGDYDCDPLPSTPDSPGLWLLTWDYQIVRHPQADADDVNLTTAKYAPTCSWTRPTLDDLVALGALPQAGAP